MAITVDAFEIDDYNESEMSRHNVSVREVDEVREGEFQLLRNAKKHDATYLMVGETLAGRLLTIPIAPTGQPGVWRPVTAFPARPVDRSKLKR